MRLKFFKWSFFNSPSFLPKLLPWKFPHLFWWLSFGALHSSKKTLVLVQSQDHCWSWINTSLTIIDYKKTLLICPVNISRISLLPFFVCQDYLRVWKLWKLAQFRSWCRFVFRNHPVIVVTKSIDVKAESLDIHNRYHQIGFIWVPLWTNLGFFPSTYI